MELWSEAITIGKALPWFAWAVSAIALSQAVSGRTSVDLARVLLVVGWAFGLVGIYYSGWLRQNIWGSSAAAALLTLLAIWMVVWYQPVLAPANFGKIAANRAFWDIKQPSLRIQIGASDVYFQWEQAQRGNLFEYIRFLQDSVLLLERFGRRILVSTRLYDQSGELVAELVRNEWKVSPRAWDRNYNDTSLEIKNAAGDVVFQVVAMPDRIRLQGEWWSPRRSSDQPARGLLLAAGPRSERGVMAQMLFLPANLKNPIKPMFRYPSDTHLGELAP